MFGTTVIARSDSDEAIHFSTCGLMDCFASLAMTSMGRARRVRTYATQMSATATFWNRCGDATAEAG